MQVVMDAQVQVVWPIFRNRRVWASDTAAASRHCENSQEVAGALGSGEGGSVQKSQV